MTLTLRQAPPLSPLCRIECEVQPLATLGPAPMGERRYVPLGTGTVSGRIHGTLVAGGVDWQWLRSDGVLEIDAHYVIQTTDGAQVEVRSQGLRHGPPEVMARLGRGEAVAPQEYFFRTLVRFTTGSGQWGHLNKMMAIAVGERQAAKVVLQLYELG